MRARGKRVLDCGAIGLTCLDDDARLDGVPQSLHWRIAEAAEAATGIDHATDVVQAAQARYPKLRLIDGDVEDLPSLVSDRYELVILGDLIEHLSNPGLTLAAVREVVAEGAAIIVTCPNAFGAPNYFRFLLGRFREGPDHVAMHNKWTLSQLLARHGFAVTELHTCLDHIPAGRLKRLIYRMMMLPLRAFPELGGTLLVVASPSQPAGVSTP